MKIVARSGSRPAASQSTSISQVLRPMIATSSYTVVSACQSATKKKQRYSSCRRTQFFNAPW